MEDSHKSSGHVGLKMNTSALKVFNKRSFFIFSVIETFT